MPDKEKVIEALVKARTAGENYKLQSAEMSFQFIEMLIELLKEQEAKPLCCKECSYHRNDGWCNEHGREVKESDYCSFGAWEGR